MKPSRKPTAPIRIPNTNVIYEGELHSPTLLSPTTLSPTLLSPMPLSPKTMSPLRDFFSGAIKRSSSATSFGALRRSSSTGGITSRTDSAAIPLPGFLTKSKSDISAAFSDLEWQQRYRLSEGAQQPSPPSQWARLVDTGEYSSRNRYGNVEPFASNRIKLRGVGDGNDYINASPIVVGTRRYISTQGPKESLVSHFYRMIAQETSSVAVVVMLTQTHEAGREKCWPYYPDSEESPPLQISADDDNDEDGFEGQVRLVSVEDNKASRAVVRHLKLRTRLGKKGDMENVEWREQHIWHLLFEGWPDFSIPEDEDQEALLQLIKLSRQLNNGALAPDDESSFTSGTPSQSEAPLDHLNPRIVHCSAGVGRSGTFIAVDHLLTLLDKGELDNVDSADDPIVDTVDKLRQQRMMMVQSEPQLHFIYKVMREKWSERWRTKQQ